MLHFAYGSNMDSAIMRRHAPAAIALGVASLPNHAFVITADGYASVVSARARVVHGVLWRLTPRDRIHPRYLGERFERAVPGRDVAGEIVRCRPCAVAGLCGPSARCRPPEGWLYGAGLGGGADVGLAGRVYCIVATLVARPAARRRLAKLREFGWT
jgi:hypothetical protein